MKNWKTKVERKKRVGNQTPGRVKGLNCQATPMEKFMAKCSRSYKHREYGTWLEKTRKTAMGR